ncbi:MAG: hypothetical protein AUH81_18440 [Candidatus Rokubacteria bacterium 13_1_40CM_4_69_5]|nr:MAG: hypothetical protein AUH81_18440 [Candidatus Rokubacteria bacterium 13_1_40CM_4_69_5]
MVERLPIARVMLNLTSSEVSSSPLWNLTPLRRWNVQRVESGEASHRQAMPPSRESWPVGVTPTR